VRWEWLLVVNAPIAVIAMIGVRLCVPANRKEELTDDALDLPGALLTISTLPRKSARASAPPSSGH
jgi:hypothetical protein